MLTEQELDRLAGGLGGLIYDNGEGVISIDQKEDGSLVFDVMDEDGNQVSTWNAKPVGQYQESPLYEFWRDGEDPEEYGSRVCTLVPSMIYGLIAL